MRELTLGDIETLLQARISEFRFPNLSDLPGPERLRDSEKAAKRIVSAIKSHERITIVGDYDVDGVCATTILFDFLQKTGADVHAVIPNRFLDGYGVSVPLLERCEGTLIITVDNGITAHEAAAACAAQNIDLIITDHHETGETLPECYALINPKQESCSFPLRDICGAQIAWYLCASIKKELELSIDLSSYLDILCLAIIADVMPLVEINRSMLKRGMHCFMQSERPAIAVLRQRLNKTKIGSEDIAFGVIPKLNAAGRMEDASLALEFLMAKTVNEATQLLVELESLNEERKSIENSVMECAVDQCDEQDSAIVLWSPHWHEGTLGIVASRLAERYKKPAVVLNVQEGIAKGSARSVGKIDLHALLSEQAHLLEKFGGHQKAAGLSLQVQHLETFRHGLLESAGRIPQKMYACSKSTPLGILGLEHIGMNLLGLLERFEPYGESAPAPLFRSHPLRVKSCRILGKNVPHTELVCVEEKSGRICKGMAFRREMYLEEHTPLMLDYSVTRNEFFNRVSAQMVIRDIVPL